MAFNVFVEGAQDSSGDGVRKLAQAMGQKFGLPAADLVSRLSSGRFRVKANVDRATADTLVRSLEEIGARVVVEDTEPPAPRPQSSSLPPIARTTTGGNARQSMQSGLAAAFTKERAQSEGDFSSLGGDSLSLASLDGDDAGTSSGENNFAPAEPAPPAPPAAPRTMTAQGAKAAPVAPADRFRPPDADEAEQVMTLADDGGDKAERATASVPPTQSAPATGSAAMRYSAKAVEPEPVLTVKDPMPNGRFAAGVFLSILLGFLPAHVIAGTHQRSEYAAIDAQVNATQAAATDEDSYRALDTFRAASIANKQSVKRSSMLMALAIWALAGALLAYVYFKRVPWDTLGQKQAA